MRDRAVILCVDQDPRQLQHYQQVLCGESSAWEVHGFTDAGEARQFLARQTVDAVLCDVISVDPCGLELWQGLAGGAALSAIPCTFLVPDDNTLLKRRLLDLGITEFLNQPVAPLDLIARVRSMLRHKALEEGLRHQTRRLEALVGDCTRQLRHSRLQIIWRLAKAAEFRDEGTGEHLVRVACYSRMLGEALGLSADWLDDLFLAAPLHDIGKIGIPDSILLKPGRLTSEERKIIQSHCVIGEYILREPSITELCAPLVWHDGLQPLVERDSMLEMARQIALSHHERWDAQGYPQNLKGTEIPLAARIVAVADVYDALTSERRYKKELPLDVAESIILRGKGTQFDPQVIDAFLRVKLLLPEVRQRVSGALGQIETCSSNHYVVLYRTSLQRFSDAFTTHRMSDKDPPGALLYRPSSEPMLSDMLEEPWEIELSL